MRGATTDGDDAEVVVAAATLRRFTHQGALTPNEVVKDIIFILEFANFANVIVLKGGKTTRHIVTNMDPTITISQ